jgi:hypothetical protein
MEEDNVRAIGKCNGCSKFAAISSGVCRECKNRFGPRFDALAEKIRRNPGFRNACYAALSTELAREKFVSMFGEHGAGYAMVLPIPSRGSR